MTFSVRTLVLLCTLSLAACEGGYFGAGGEDGGDGGGGGGDSGNDAQGIWTGTTSDRFNFHMLVTPNNEVWGLSWDEGFSVDKLWKGRGSQNGRTFTAEGKNFGSGEGGTGGDATLSGTVSSGSTFDGNLGQNVTFTSSFNSQYNEAFNLGSYAGTWAGRDSAGASVTFTIDANGEFDADSRIPGRPDDCTISGTLRAADSDKNYATTTLTFGSATNCFAQHASSSMPGVAIKLTGAEGTQPLLLVEGVKSDESAAWFAYARKQADPAPAAPTP